jgi:hypothetical protein
VCGPDGGECRDLITCVVCEHCEEHCLIGMFGALRNGIVASGASEEAMEDLSAENGLRPCSACGGLEDPKHPHRRYRVSAL